MLYWLTQLNEDELKNYNFQNITHPEDLNKALAFFEQLTLGEIDNYNEEKRYLRKYKSVVWVESSVNCLRKANGEIDFIIAVSENVTEKNKLILIVASFLRCRKSYFALQLSMGFLNGIMILGRRYWTTNSKKC